ncbi:MAG TPA: DUF2231 domain-containing protein [Steroidobacteraceae bacterium]
MGPYHAIMVHFPVALWAVASGVIVFRWLSDGPLAQAFDRVLVALLTIGVGTGLVAYVLGLLVWPPETLQATPLGRNHMMAATWTLTDWAAVLFVRWRAGDRAWSDGSTRMIIVGLGLLGAGLLAITGTLGGHLHGAPAFLSDVLRQLGWEVYQTVYLPTWMLVVLAVLIIAMPVIAMLARRGHAARRPLEESAT